ncbi:diguanylate cyclase [Acidovorax sp. Root275]|uniref:GGDEF domain-containing protein n=1 Tax=unclassified Acidovorax TaxID=2684926 RepID=UPI00070DEB3E|nr:MULTISPECIES: GGDEF domain-containing protein [unclassified Acidovorax]KRD25301.1 diguanylate cyclase [Acidovorax sp. Root267]KRD55948.1 diguanylate cyclase [Acidovorax sp. Root275]
MGIHQRQFLFGKTLTTSWPSAIQIQHWTQVLGTLRARLLNPSGDTIPNGLAPTPTAKPGPDFNLRECVAALEEMHQALERETAQRQELERTYQGTHLALIQAEADLACVRSGERRARHQALHDELTALPNRRHLLQQLGHALAQRRPGHPGPTVIYIDLDHFKAVNDTHGHGVGDEVLRIAAARLSAAVRHGDLVVRLGGDEFACLLQGIADTGPLRQLCSKLLDAVSRPMKVASLQLRVCPSIGVAICPQHGTAAEDLLACADAAMYAAKRDRRGFAFYGEAS